MKTREEIIEIVKKHSIIRGFTYDQSYSISEKQLSKIADALTEPERKPGAKGYHDVEEFYKEDTEPVTEEEDELPWSTKAIDYVKTWDEDKIDRAYMKWYFGSDDYVIPNPNDPINNIFYAQLNTWRGCIEWLQSHPTQDKAQWISVEKDLPKQSHHSNILLYSPVFGISFGLYNGAWFESPILDNNEKLLDTITHYQNTQPPK